MNTSCVPHSTRYNTNARILTQRDRTWRASVRTPRRNSRHECRDPITTLQHETRHADERAHGTSTLKAARSHETRTWREYQGSVTKPWITLDWSDRTLTLPPQKVTRDTKNKTETWQHKNMTTQRLTHNNRPDKNNQNTETKRGGREGGKPSQCQQGSKAGPGRDGRVEPGRPRQSRSPGKEPGWSRRDGPGRIRPNRDPGGWPGRGRRDRPGWL